MLNHSDRDAYNDLRLKLQSKPRPLADNLAKIRTFCQKRDGEEWKRYLVCGVCWLIDGELAINFRNLRILVNASKSTLNNELKKSGYITVPQRSCNLINQIPYLEKNATFLREWTIKSLAPVTPQPVVPSMDGLSKVTWSNSPEPGMHKLNDVIAIRELREIEKKQIEEDFWDDPFCLPPAFLLDEQRSCLCTCK